MYKSKLQELCHRRGWELPHYAAVKDGPDHMPSFTATVNVHGNLFGTPQPCKSSKDAQNTAARIAFEHLNSNPPAPSSGVCDLPPPQIQPVPPTLPLSPVPSSLPHPPLGLLTTKYNNNAHSVKEASSQENCSDTTECPAAHKNGIGSESKDVLHVYKNLLQQHAQKENLGFPVYTPEAEGPPHARRFKSKVSVNGKSYETSDYFPTLKEAEQAAARIACQELSIDVIQEDKGLYKNLLQELAQKKGLPCPSYETHTAGLPHKPIFMSAVEIGSNIFQGSEAKTRKQAEMNAAKAAYNFLTKGCPPTNSSAVSSVNNFDFADTSAQNIQPIAKAEKLEAATCPEPTPKLAGCPATNSLAAPSVNSFGFADNSSQNIQPIATTEKLKAATCPEPTPKLAGCPAADSSVVSSVDICSLSQNLSPNSQPTATTEKHLAATDEDGHQQAKRAKYEIENVDTGAHPDGIDDPKMENSTAAECVSGL